MKNLTPILTLTVCLWAGMACMVQAQVFNEKKKIVTNPQLYMFGRSVATFQDFMAISSATLTQSGSPASQGTITIYQRDHGGTENWGELKRIDPPPLTRDVYLFGNPVAMDGDYLVAGAGASEKAKLIGGISETGSFFIFKRNQGGTDNWGFLAQRFASDAAFRDYLAPVDISGNYIIAGAEGADNGGNNRGAAYIFKKNQGGIDNWGELLKLSISDGADHDIFGYDVAIDGKYAIVGAPKDDDNGSRSGSVYIFKRDQGGVDNWGLVKKITAFDGAADDEFGYSVDIDGEFVVVGAPFAPLAGDTIEAGAVYIFQRNLGGKDNWGFSQKLQATDHDEFGISVAIHRNQILVGATLGGPAIQPQPNLGPGRSFLFERNTVSNNWSQVGEFVASDESQTRLEHFGNSVALSSEHSVIGCYFDSMGNGNSLRGSAYLFDNPTLLPLPEDLNSDNLSTETSSPQPLLIPDGLDHISLVLPPSEHEYAHIEWFFPTGGSTSDRESLWTGATHSLSTSHLPVGIYFLRVIWPDGKTHTLKSIKY